MERLIEEDRVTLSLNDGRTVDVTAGIDRLLSYVAENGGEPDKLNVIDCPICGAKSGMKYIVDSVNGHIHAMCHVCNVSLIE